MIGEANGNNNNNNKGTKIFQRDIIIIRFRNFSRIFHGSIVNTELIK